MDIDKLCVNTIWTLSMDAVQAANSGHPGTAMAMAPVVYCVWQKFLRYDPHDPVWPDRDLFVLSIGHASMLLYSMLHLCGVRAVNPRYETLGELAVKLEDIKRSVDTLKSHGVLSIILLGGGEPTLHKYFGEIVRYIKSKGVQLGIVTNGSSLYKVKNIVDLLCPRQ